MLQLQSPQMDTLAGYIASICVGAVGQYLSQFVRPKIKIKYWLTHQFIYAIPQNQFPVDPAVALPAGANVPVAAPPAPPFRLLSQSLTVQNFGRERAEWVEIVHKRRPDLFQLDPPLAYTEVTSATGEHTLRISSLASKEFVTVQFLGYTHMPELSFIRSTAGHGKPMLTMTVRKFPQWIYMTMWVLMILGGGFCLYWLIKGAAFVLRSVGAFH